MGGGVDVEELGSNRQMGGIFYVCFNLLNEKIN